MVLDTPRKDCPYVFQKKPTLPSSSRQALRGNDGISRARAESHIAECANARFRPPLFFCTLPLVCVCHNEKKGARRMANTTSDTGDTSSKQQQAQCKENYNKSKRPVSSVDHCHPLHTEEKREEKQFTKPTHVAVYLFRDLDRDRSRL